MDLSKIELIEELKLSAQEHMSAVNDLMLEMQRLGAETSITRQSNTNDNLMIIVKVKL